MAIPAFTGLQTALSGLQAAQAAIDTTSENISNANTPGYTRQRVNMGESGALIIPGRTLQGGGTQLGTGVTIQDIGRIRDQFLDVQYRAQNTATSNANTNASELGQVQTAINEPSDAGLQSVMSKFWSAWAALGQAPTSPAAQQAVLGAGQSLASTFNAVSAQMQTVQSQALQQYNTLMGPNGQVQSDAQQIAALNAQIGQATQAGQTPNALLDQRDSLIDDLSSLAQVSVTTGSNGAVTINFGDDTSSPLVNGTTVNFPPSITSAAGGQLGALLNLTSSTGPIGSMLTSLDAVAGQVSSQVNALQPSSSPFFSGTTAGTLAVSATAPSTSSTSTSGPDWAQAIGNLAGGAPDQSYAAFVAQVGTSVQAANSTQSTQQAVLTAVSNQRQSVSGVSLDEEMTNLIQFQQAYQASARVMNAINSTLDTLINSVGAGL